MLRGTPFHSRTAPLCQAQNWRRWSGYLAASSYELHHEMEYFAIRNAAAAIDVSPLFKYRIRGRDAARLLDRVVTRDVSRCAVGRVLYTPWCDEQGKVLDDGTVQRLGEAEFRLTSAEPNLRWLWENAAGLEVEIEDESERTAALALQGPNAREVLCRLADEDLSGLRYFRLAHVRLGDIPVQVSRTGYTGDLGYEIWVPAEHAERLWDLVFEAGRPYGLMPAGLLALDVARVEAALILIEVDYVPARRALIDSQKSSPFEIGLGWTVKLEKPYFVGREALVREAERLPQWRLMGIEVPWDGLERVYGEFGLPPQVTPTASRSSVPVYVGGQQVGYVTSHTWSPLLKKYIGLVHLEAPFARPGTEVEMEFTVEHRRRRAPAFVVERPFYDPERKRA